VGKEARGVLLVESIAIKRGAPSEESNVFNLGRPVFQVATGFEVAAGLEIHGSELTPVIVVSLQGEIQSATPTTARTSAMAWAAFYTSEKERRPARMKS
jgi:hypothetical protein